MFEPGDVHSFEGDEGVRAVGVKEADSKCKSTKSGTIGLTPELPAAVIGLRTSKRAIHSCQLVCYTEMNSLQLRAEHCSSCFKS